MRRGGGRGATCELTVSKVRQSQVSFISMVFQNILADLSASLPYPIFSFNLYLGGWEENWKRKREERRDNSHFTFTQLPLSPSSRSLVPGLLAYSQRNTIRRSVGGSASVSGSGRCTRFPFLTARSPLPCVTVHLASSVMKTINYNNYLN